MKDFGPQNAVADYRMAVIQMPAAPTELDQERLRKSIEQMREAWGE